MFVCFNLMSYHFIVTQKRTVFLTHPLFLSLSIPLSSCILSAIIGPPNVSLTSHGAAIEVAIEDPVFAISALRNVYNYATYNITYWKNSQKEKVS